MRPRERRETSEQDLFRTRLDQIIDMNHALGKLARAIDWRFLEERFGAVYTDKPGQPPLPTRLMAGLAILKHTYDLSDEALCDRWVESPYFQYFCGEEFFQHALVFDRYDLLHGLPASSSTRCATGHCGPARTRSETGRLLRLQNPLR
jgi:IS5 family transposase